MERHVSGMRLALLCEECVELGTWHKVGVENIPASAARTRSRHKEVCLHWEPGNRSFLVEQILKKWQVCMRCDRHVCDLKTWTQITALTFRKVILYVL